MKTSFRIYTGPTITYQMADKLIAAGVQVTIIGTEHVHVLTTKTKEQIIKVLGPTFTWKDISVMGQEQ